MFSVETTYFRGLPRGQGLGVRGYGSGLRAQGLGLRAQGLGLRGRVMVYICIYMKSFLKQYKPGSVQTSRGNSFSQLVTYSQLAKSNSQLATLNFNSQFSISTCTFKFQLALSSFNSHFQVSTRTFKFQLVTRNSPKVTRALV